MKISVRFSQDMRHSMSDLLAGSASDALYQVGIETTGSWTDGGLLKIDEKKQSCFE